MKTNTNYLLCVTSMLAYAGMATTAAAAEGAAAGEQTDSPLYRPFTLSLDAGSMGFGGSGSWRFADYWGARFGADYFSYSGADVKVSGLSYNSTLRLLSEPLTLDVYPWLDSSFHISAGILFNQNKLTGTADQTGTIIINGVPVPVALVGTLDMKVEQQPVNPYLSIGGNLLYFDRAHRWALGGELGVVYTGDPRTSVTRTGPPSALADAAVAAAEDQLHDYATKFKWWPVLKLTVTYSF